MSPTPQLATSGENELLQDESGSGATEHIKVIVRVRPLLERELNETTKAVVDASADRITVRGEGPSRQVQCRYDAVLGPDASQVDAYLHVNDCIAAVLEGVNCTIFAYGQTGSGKTHSMFGPPQLSTPPAGSSGTGRHRMLNHEVGIIPRAVSDLFNGVEALAEAESHHNAVATAAAAGGGGRPNVSIWCSLVQIYNEQVFDMLRDPQRSRPLAIHEDATAGTYCQGLSEYAVHSAEECLQLLHTGEEHRAVRETHMNQASSRSHSIFQVTVEQRLWEGEDGGERLLRSKFNLVDLAGSEKWDVRQEMGEERVSEMTNINVSLYTLGRVISALSKKGASVGGALDADGNPAGAHIPYRDSKLTRLLRDSLGGNTRTCLVATLSPSAACVDETISTLRFASRAKTIASLVRINERRAVDRAMVEKLQGEVARLRALVKRLAGEASAGGGGGSGSGSGNGDVRVLLARETLLEVKLSEAHAEVQRLHLVNARLQRSAAARAAASPVPSPQRASLDPQAPEGFGAAVAAAAAQYDVGLVQSVRLSGGGGSNGRFEVQDLSSRVLRAEAAAAMAKATSTSLASAFTDLQSQLDAFFRFEIEEEQLKADMAAVAARVRIAQHSGGLAASAGDAASSGGGGSAMAGSNSLPSRQQLRLPAVPGAGIHTYLRDDESSCCGSCSQGGGGGARAPPQLPYRVRGKRAEEAQLVTEHLRENEEGTQERRLRRELRRAKERMRKNLTLQAWLRRKEEAQLEEIRADEAARYAAEEVRRAEENAFRKRAERQKRKLREYYVQMQGQAAGSSDPVEYNGLEGAGEVPAIAVACDNG